MSYKNLFLYALSLSLLYFNIEKHKLINFANIYISRTMCFQCLHIHSFFSLLGSITEAKQNEGMLDASLSFVCSSHLSFI